MPTRDAGGTDRPDRTDRDRLVRLLWAARETGLLDAVLTTAGTPADVADAAGVTRRAATVTVEALAEAGLLAPVGDEYEPTNRALGLFAKRDLRSIGRLPHAIDVYGCYRRLPGTMVTGEAPDRPADWLPDRLGAELAGDPAAVRARVTAAVRAREATGPPRVLDVAGGAGVHAREFCARGAAAVRLSDAPAVVDAVAPLLAPTGVTPVEATPPAVAWGGDDPPDLAFAADLARRLSDDGLATLLAGVRDRLAPDGVVVLVDAVRDRTPGAAGVAVETFAVHGADARVRTSEAFEAALVAAGFDPVVRSIPGVDAAAVVGRRDD